MLFEKYGILGKNNKLDTYKYYFKMLLGKLDSIFAWENLPKTIDPSFLNTNLFLLGYSAFFEINGNLYTNFGGIGGKPNENYYPTNFILSNPVIGEKQLIINSGDKDTAKIIYNSESDKQFINFYGAGGMYRLLKQTATLLADNVQSINMAQINSRVQSIFRASDDRQKNTAEELIKRMYNGEPYQVITSDDLNVFDTINLESSTSEIIETLLEVHQYILAEFYNQIGIPTTPYQKKERLITDEINTLDKTNACNIYTMLNARQMGIESVNKKFNANIRVRVADWIKDTGSQADTGGENNGWCHIYNIWRDKK